MRVAVVAIVVLAVVLSENVVYFRTVSEAVADRRAQGHDRFRLAGKVVPGSVVETAKGVRFRVTDGKATATVVHIGDPPDLFKAGAPVVCEGRWGSGERLRLRPDHDPSRQRLPPTQGRRPASGRQRVKASLGVLALALGASAAALGIVVLARGLRRRDDQLLALGRRFVFIVFGAAILAVLVMEWALLSHDFSLQYVAENNARATPTLFTVTGLWAALEGSILLWLLILGGYLAFVAHKFRSRASDPLVAWATLIGLVVALFFFALVLGPANPFKTLPLTPADGRGPNPLLQNHPLMAFHPPMLYLGYVGFTVPFMFGMAALVTGQVRGGLAR